MIKKLNNFINKIETSLGRTKLISLPRYAQIEPTNRCNEKCVFCPRNEANYDVPLGDMSFDQFKSILKQIPTLTDIQINGLGEPLLNKDILTMIKYAANRGISVAMNSNVTVVNEEMAKKLVSSGLGLLKVSVDTTDPKVYQSIRKGNFENAINGIKNLVKAKKELGLSKPSIWFNSIILKQNIDELSKIIKLGEELGIDQVRFKPIDTFDLYQKNDLLVDNNKLLETLEATQKECKNLKIKHNLDKLIDEFKNYYRPPQKLPCFSPWYEVYIQYYGGVRLCCEFYSKKYDVGNIFEQGFRNVWNSKKYQHIRASFSKGDTYFPVCQTCNRFKRNIRIYNKLKKLKLR
ncbi:MAG: radical SAM protein [Patescibacteria group bacterium]|jgi:radical SAM protein with 4Fe4S-binding SPASM domain